MAAGPRTADQLIVIVGPTGSGKSGAAMKAALKHDGEIICADSRTIYKGLDIGTAKPSLEDRAKVRHHLLDVVEPNEAFSAAKFQRLAEAAIRGIRSRGRLPVLVGGSGLFIDGVLFGYQFGNVADPILRAKLEQKNVEELRSYCAENNIELPKNEFNKRHLVRSIEQQGTNRKRNATIRQDAYVVGITPYKNILQNRLQKRAEQIFSKNVIKEATKTAKSFGWDAPGLSGNIYPIIHQVVAGNINTEEAITQFVKTDWQLARRQMTWFRRNSSIHWCDSGAEAVKSIDSYLANVH